MKEFELKLTVILVKDKNIGGFTAYVAEMPEVVTEGNTEDEATSNLFDALHDVLKFKREMNLCDDVTESVTRKEITFKAQTLDFSYMMN